MNREIKKAIWRAMLDADMNARYWKSLVRRYVERDRRLKICLAAMALGTVAAWGKWEEIAWLWKILSSASAIVAISLPFLDYQRKIEKMSALAEEWGRLRMEYEDLWRQVKTQDLQSLEEGYKEVRGTEANLQGKEIKLPIDAALLKRCQDEVKKARGLS